MRLSTLHHIRMLPVLLLMSFYLLSISDLAAAPGKRKSKSRTSNAYRAKKRKKIPVRILLEPFEPKKEYDIHGIDISRHCGAVDWNAIAEQDIDFAIFKSTEGATYTDPNYKTYVEGAKRIGLPIGAYHFFRFESNAEAQLRNFINAVNIEELDIPPVFDLEEAKKINVPGLIDTIMPKIDYFLTEVERLYNIKMLIYANVNDYNKYIKGRYDDFPLWICSLRDTAAINDKWVLWQYSHKVKVDGIRSAVDMNVFHGSQEDWQTFLRQTRVAYKEPKPKCFLEEYKFVKDWKDVYFIRNRFYIQGVNTALSQTNKNVIIEIE